MRFGLKQKGKEGLLLPLLRWKRSVELSPLEGEGRDRGWGGQGGGMMGVRAE